MRVALTGASGLVGSQTARALAAAGHEVRGLVRTGTAPEIADVHRGDFADPSVAARLVAGCGALVHAAVHWSLEKPTDDENFAHNVAGTAALLDAARAAGAQVLFVSSAAVYHGLPPGPVGAGGPVRPTSVYAASKIAVEALLAAYHATYGLNTSWWRPPMLYGRHPVFARSRWFDPCSATDGYVAAVDDVAAALALAVGDPDVAGRGFDLADCYVTWDGGAPAAGVPPRPIARGDWLERRPGLLRRGIPGVEAYLASLRAS